MKKTLLITYYFPPNVGGGEEYLYNIYKRLPADKVVVLAHGQPTEFDEQQKFKIYRTNFFAGIFKPTWWPLIKIVRQIIQKQKIEVIHFGHYAHYILLARILKIPYLTFIQGTDLTSYTKLWFGKQLTKSNLKKAQEIITSSHYLKNEIIKLRIKKNKVKVLHPGINLEEYNFKPETTRYDPPVGEEAGRLVQLYSPQVDGHTKKKLKIILSVGRLNQVKGFDLVIRALPNILKQIPNAIYIIIGQGEEKENLKKLTKKLNLENKVIFTGEVRSKKELSKYYVLADVYIGPSRAEGFGLVFLEARAFGLPIVASDVGGVREAVGDRGVFIKSENIDGLIQNIIKILKENLPSRDLPPLGHELGAEWKGDRKYEPEKNFSWDKKIEKIKEILT